MAVAAVCLVVMVIVLMTRVGRMGRSIADRDPGLDWKANPNIRTND